MARRQCRHRISAVSIDSWMGALRERNFRLYFVGQLTSWIGTDMTMVALAFAAFRSGRSATALGIVLMAGAVPLAVFILVGGVIAGAGRPVREPPFRLGGGGSSHGGVTVANVLR